MNLSRFLRIAVFLTIATCGPAALHAAALACGARLGVLDSVAAAADRRALTGVRAHLAPDARGGTRGHVVNRE